MQLTEKELKELRRKFKIEIPEDQKKEFVFHADQYASYGFCNELQKSRMNLILSNNAVQLLEYYRFGAVLRLVVMDDHKPVRYSIDLFGNYLINLIPTA